MDRIRGKLTLVGAGPGDPELISVKGLKAIQKATVILYDALVSSELLKEAPQGCRLVYVGKRKGRKEFAQEEINKLLVFYATRFSDVVRLKGGDPYVFGRGHEELEYAMKHGVAVNVISGISSAISAPAAAGIPLTRRGLNESFWVITGTLSNGSMSNDIALAAKSSATVVVLMGLSHLKDIAALFQKERSASEPMAVISKATTPEQMVVTGTAFDIAARAQQREIASPAVIVIGKVVGSVYDMQEVVTHTQVSTNIIFNH
jgi:uroporphyrin-III C-methyltransferase